MALMRINKELKDLTASPIEGCKISVSEESMLNWTVTIDGPAGSPYEGGKYVVTLTFTNDYPFKGPKALFKTKIFHPNVDNSNGIICLDVLTADKWSPATKVSKILIALVSRIAHPDPENPLAGEVANLLKTDSDKFNETAKEWTQKYAV